MKPKKMTIASIRNSISRPLLRRGLPRKQQLPRTQAMWIIRGFLLIPLALALAWLALASTAQAVCRQGCDPTNTFLGEDALNANTTGFDNTAIGADALASNTTGYENTATGNNALSNNTTGAANTATGLNALSNNTTGFENTATGSEALLSNTTGSENTATGFSALFHNTTGGVNSAYGGFALYSNTTGNFNTANGFNALYSNTSGFNNTANGFDALLSNSTGNLNTANGVNALLNNTGSNNIALGFEAGLNRTTGSNNIDIGNKGAAGKSNIIRIGTNGTQKNAYIAGISGVTVAGGVGVIIDSDGHLGTVVSSARFKDEIKPMDKASEAILALQPVTFRYKHELDPEGIPQFGLVAEQVEKVNPALVARDDQGKPYTVRYEAVNAMLLNEFLKEHRKVEEQGGKLQEQAAWMQSQDRKVQELEATVARLQSAFKEQASQIQKVSAQLEVTKRAPQMVLNNP
jgi:hypothetical protein